jgi:hypothetical protein
MNDLLNADVLNWLLSIFNMAFSIGESAPFQTLLTFIWLLLGF